MGKISVYGKRLSLILKSIGAIAPGILGLTLGCLPGQAAELQYLATTLSSRSNAQQDVKQTLDQNIKQLAPEDGSAEDLQPSSILQSDEPPDLPVLEPSILLDQPVSVPPIEPLEAPVAPTSAMPSVSVPPLMPPVVASPPEIVEPVESIKPVGAIETAETAKPIEAIETAETTDPVDSVEMTETAEIGETTETTEMTEIVDAVETTEIVDAVDAIDTTEAAVSPTQNESEIPLEPPFLGGLAERAAPPATSVAVPDLIPDSTALPASSAPAAPASNETLASGGSTPPPLPAVTEPGVTEPVPALIPAVRPSNTSRWPAPIPFGQPLPQ